jgi:hypothetical protein
MKKLLFFAIAYLGISLLGCQDGMDENQFLDRDLIHYRNIGEEIPVETGVRWIQAYRSREQKAGRVELLFTNYSVSASKLEQLLTSVDGITGVAFHYALDAFGQRHFILIPVDESLSLWESDDEKKYIDANTNTFISKQTAQTWTANYEAANPGEIWFHFFGSDIFDEILTISYFEDLLIEPALNDLNLSPQLLLIILNGGGFLDDLLGGRAKEGEQGRVYDASSPCPPCAVH